MTLTVNRDRTNPCPTCGAPVYESRSRSGMGPAGYCDVVCYAAGNTLTPAALLLWRANCSKLDASASTAARAMVRT